MTVGTFELVTATVIGFICGGAAQMLLRRLGQ